MGMEPMCAVAVVHRQRKKIKKKKKKKGFGFFLEEGSASFVH